MTAETVALSETPISFTAPWWTPAQRAWLLWYQEDGKTPRLQDLKTCNFEKLGAIGWACDHLLDAIAALPGRPERDATPETIQSAKRELLRVQGWIQEVKLWAALCVASLHAAGVYSIPSVDDALKRNLYEVEDEDGVRVFKRYDQLRLWFRYRTPEYRQMNRARSKTAKNKAYRRRRYAAVKMKEQMQ